MSHLHLLTKKDRIVRGLDETVYVNYLAEGLPHASAQ